MTSLVERLRTTSTKRTWDSVGRPYDYPKHLSLEAADRIESLERENAELREWRQMLGNQLQNAIAGCITARLEALEEAAAYHDDLAAQHEAVPYESEHHTMMHRLHMRFAAAIRALAGKEAK